VARSEGLATARDGDSARVTAASALPGADSAPKPAAAAASNRFCAAQPSDTNRWWSSGSTLGQRRDQAGRIDIERSASAKRQHWVLWLAGARGARRTSS